MKEKIRISITIAMIIIAAAFIYIGVHRGEPMMVMMKAVRVCMECIGLGK